MALSSGKQNKKGGKFFPALCGILGTLTILAVILSLLPITLPRLLGYEIYHIVSGSMAPAIPAGSMVLIKPVSPSEIAEGDVIAFVKENAVVTHRVIEIDNDRHVYITKGDANDDPDISPASFGALIGRVDRHIPVIGGLSAVLSTTRGKMYLFAVLLGGVLLRWLSDRLRGEA